MKNKKFYGFIEPVIEKDHYVLGFSSVPKNILMANKDWRTVWTPQAHQGVFFETYDCTAFNTLSSISRLVFMLTGEKVTYSPRWVGIVAGTRPPGNDPHVVCEAIRKFGLIPDEMLPWTENIKDVGEYYSFKDANEKACYVAGALWLKRFEFFHEWVFKGDVSPEKKIKAMIESLQYSPLGISVTAWNKKDLLYVSNEEQNNHWTEQVSLNQLESWIIDDSYTDENGSYEKLLEWAFDFQYCKRYHLVLRPTKPKSKSLFSRLFNFLKKKHD